MTASSNSSRDSQIDGGLWSVAEVAAYLRVSRSWVYHRVAAGELPCLHIGALVRFEPESIRAYARGTRAERAKILPFVARPDRGPGSK
jgi:excisionase family DNA binding protein